MHEAITTTRSLTPHIVQGQVLKLRVGGWECLSLRMMPEAQQRPRQNFEEGIDPSLGVCELRRQCCSCDESLPSLPGHFMNYQCFSCGHLMHRKCATWVCGGRSRPPAYFCQCCSLPDESDTDENTDTNARSLVELNCCTCWVSEEGLKHWCLTCIPRHRRACCNANPNCACSGQPALKYARADHRS